MALTPSFGLADAFCLASSAFCFIGNTTSTSSCTGASLGIGGGAFTCGDATEDFPDSPGASSGEGGGGGRANGGAIVSQADGLGITGGAGFATATGGGFAATGGTGFTTAAGGGFATTTLFFLLALGVPAWSFSFTAAAVCAGLEAVFPASTVSSHASPAAAVAVAVA